jgi:hypothetical protein
MSEEPFSTGTDPIPVPPQSGEWSFTALPVSHPAPPSLLTGIEQIEPMAFERQAAEDAPPLSSRITTPPLPALPIPSLPAPAASPSVLQPMPPTPSPAALPGLSPASRPSSTPAQPEITTLTDGSTVRKLPNGSIMRRFPNGRIEITGFTGFAALAAAQKSEPHRGIPISPAGSIPPPDFFSPAFRTYREQSAALIQRPSSPPVENSDDVESSGSEDSSENDTNPPVVSNLSLAETEIEET